MTNLIITEDTNELVFEVSQVGAFYFKDLVDTPTTYTGQANKLLAVKADETGIEFTDSPTVVDWDEIGGDQKDINLSGFTNDLDTDDIPEGLTNLYYTDTRVRAAVTNSSPITYAIETGTFGLAYNTENLTEGDGGLDTIQNINITSSPTFAGLTVGESSAMLKRVLGVLTDATADSDYQGVVTWNDGLVYSNGIANIDYNTTNLKITDSKINTIQNINTTATPQFTGVKVDKIQAITDSSSAIIIEDTIGTDIITIDTTTPATNVYANLNIYGDITQNGSAYETHAEQIYTKDDLIITRDGAVAGLGVGEYSGIQAHLYDGVNDGQLVFDKDGWARVGDVGDLQKLATIEETPTGDAVVYWDNSDLQLKTLDTVNTTELGYLANVTGTTGTNKLVLDTSPTIVSPTINTSLTTNYLTSGSVLFAGTSKEITQDNSNLFWDNSNKRLGIRTTSPAGQLHVYNNVADATSTLTVDKHNASATGYIADFQFNGTSKASVSYLGQISTISNFKTPNGMINDISSNNSYVNTSNNGTVISRNVADANTALIVNQVHASSTGKILDLQFAGTSKSWFSYNGYLYAPLIANITSAVNSEIALNTNGTLISRNVADTNPTARINQYHASSTGDILQLEWQSVDRFNVAYDGTTTLSNDKWLRAKDYAGTGVVNMFKVNTSNEIDVGGTLNIGTLSLSEDSGLTSMINLPVSATPTDGTQEAYTFNIDSDVVLKVHALADGSGGVDNKAVIIATEDLEVPDISLSNGQTTFYLDETSNTLVVKCKYSNGTVKTGTVALT